MILTDLSWDVTISLNQSEWLFGGDRGLEPPSHDDKNGIFQLSLCFHLHQSPLCLYIKLCDSRFIWIFRAFPAHQTATFSIVLAPTILRSGAVRLPTWCRTNWISVCRASFHRVTAPNGALRLLLFHAYFSVHQYVKDLFFFPICRALIWRKIVDARTTYFTRYVDLPLRLQRESTKRN